MTPPVELREDREQLVAMILELQTNPTWNNQRSDH